jgi:hypothetical protein
MELSSPIDRVMTALIGSVSLLLNLRGTDLRKLLSQAASVEGERPGEPGGAGVVEVEMKLSIPAILWLGEWVSRGTGFRLAEEPRRIGVGFS